MQVLRELLSKQSYEHQQMRDTIYQHFFKKKKKLRFSNFSAKKEHGTKPSAWGSQVTIGYKGAGLQHIERFE